jgi:hypothetical protein
LIDPLLSSRRPAPEFQVVEIDADHVKAVIHNLVILVWRFRTLVGPYRAAIALIQKHALLHPEGVGVLQVVETEAVPPDTETRKAFKDALGVSGIQHFSVTHEGTGFTAASVRAIVSGVHMLARPSFPHSVQKSVAAAARWAAAQNERIGRHDDWRSIERTMQELRRLHRERYPGPPS